jgi:hypothetical protein
MDPVSTAIIAALNVGISEVVKDSYNTLKGALQKKFGENNDLVSAVKMLENKPDSTSHQNTLKEKIETNKVWEDKELNKLAEGLLKKLQETSEGYKVIKKYNIKAEKIGAVGGIRHCFFYNVQDFPVHPHHAAKWWGRNIC